MKEFLSYVKPYKRDCVLAIFCIMAETVFELVIPPRHGLHRRRGCGQRRHPLYCHAGPSDVRLRPHGPWVLGQGASVFAARCGQGLGAELRKAEFAKLQQFSFVRIQTISAPPPWSPA